MQTDRVLERDSADVQGSPPREAGEDASTGGGGKTANVLIRAMSRMSRLVDDRMNPIVVKELRQAVRSRFVAGLLILFLIGSFVATAIYVITSPELSTSFVGGRRITAVLYHIVTISCMVFVPIYAAVRMAGERSGDNVDLMFITTIRSGAIIRGKMVGAATITLLIFSACMPFLTFTYLLRGVDLPTVFFLLTFAFLMTLAVTQFTLMLACLPVSRFVRLLLSLVALGAIAMAIAALVSGGEEALDFGLPVDSSDFWQVIGTMAGVGLGGMGLLYCFSVFLITPPSANRALPVRLYVTGLWLVSGILFWWLADEYAEPRIVGTWSVCAMILFTLLLLVASSERAGWGLRVRKRIPRNRLFRPIAFLFYSGSGGGVTWCVLMMLLSVLSVLAAFEVFTGGSGYDYREDVLETISLIGLYGFCYIMSGTLLRASFLRKFVQPRHAWLIVMLLVAAGCLLPMLLGFMVGGGGYYRRNDEILAIGNPFYLVVAPHRLHVEAALVVTVIWAFSLLIPTAIWVALQYLNFKPLPRPAPARPDGVAP